jgi:hypothetical protein
MKKRQEYCSGMSEATDGLVVEIQIAKNLR